MCCVSFLDYLASQLSTLHQFLLQMFCTLLIDIFIAWEYILSHKALALTKNNFAVWNPLIVNLISHNISFWTCSYLFGKYSTLLFFRRYQLLNQSVGYQRTLDSECKNNFLSKFLNLTVPFLRLAPYSKDTSFLTTLYSVAATIIKLGIWFQYYTLVLEKTIRFIIS